MKSSNILLTFILSVVITLGFSQNKDLKKYGIASEKAPAGLFAGDAAPATKGTTEDGASFNLQDALKNGPVALIFYRGYWCPYCSRALGDYADSLAYLQENNVQLVAITPETYENVEKTVDETGASFTIISDRDGKIMEAYGVKFRVTDDYNGKIERGEGQDIAAINGYDEPELPIPATYLIVPDVNYPSGKIIWRHFDPDYKKRASVLDMVRAADKKE